ncbi:MAG: hypothetical protein JST80_10990 [Bdellovibrionales bacterium]|nr:hypothetical protein [Bdellovibrionales bacterium]
MSQILLWVTDPWNTLAHSQDTTLRLSQEARNSGIQSYWSGSDVLLNLLNPSHFNAVPSDALERPDSMKFIELDPSKIHQIHYRVDPPVDFNYLSLLEKIVQHSGSEDRIFSPPSLIRVQSEKIAPAELALLAPTFAVVRDEASLREAFTRFKGHSTVVSKPLNEAQSKGVKKWPRPLSLDSWMKTFATETQNFSSPIVIQEYLSGIEQGEIRMWFAAGEFIAALKKYPKSGDFRVLIDEGSKVAAYTLSPIEMKIAGAVGAVLKKQRVALAAIDFIASTNGTLKLSDYNITSPGLLVQLEKVHGQNFAKTVLQKIITM